MRLLPQAVLAVQATRALPQLRLRRLPGVQKGGAACGAAHAAVLTIPIGKSFDDKGMRHDQQHVPPVYEQLALHIAVRTSEADSVTLSPRTIPTAQGAALHAKWVSRTIACSPR